MPRRALAFLLTQLTFFATLTGGAAAASSGGNVWRAPIVGATILGSFRYDPARPFAAGGRRGIDFAGAPGSPVRSACSGLVLWAGGVPGGHDAPALHGVSGFRASTKSAELGTSIQCGELVATELGLASVAVRRGDRVMVGQPLGALGARGVLRLGARRASSRFAYLDPAALLTADHRRWAPPPVVAPPRRTPSLPHVPPPRTGPALVPTRSLARPLAVKAPRPASHAVPVPAWIGLALVAAGTIAGGGATRARHRSGARTKPRLATQLTRPTSGPVH